MKADVLILSPFIDLIGIIIICKELLFGGSSSQA